MIFLYTLTVLNERGASYLSYNIKGTPKPEPSTFIPYRTGFLVLKQFFIKQ